MSQDSQDLDLVAEFPIKGNYIFMNHAGVAPIPLSTLLAIAEFAREAAEQGPIDYPSWLRGMAQAREACGLLLGCDANDVCFVKNTTHGLLIVANSINWKPGDNVVTLAHEFPANVYPWQNLGARGVEVRRVEERPDYSYGIDDIARAIDSRTRLLAVSWVEYSTGFRNDIAALGRLCREKNVMLCVDGIQGLGVVPCDVDAMGVDFIVADGHKWLLAPEGCGLMYVRRERIAELNNSMLGWCGLKAPQEYDNAGQDYLPNAKRFEEGSHNLMSTIALGTSINVLLSYGIDRVSQRVSELTARLIEGLRKKGYTVNTPEDPARRAGIVSFIRSDVDPTAMAKSLLDEHRVAIAARRGFLRASPHFYNDAADIDALLAALP